MLLSTLITPFAKSSDKFWERKRDVKIYRLTQSTSCCKQVFAHANPYSSGAAVLQLKKTFGEEHPAKYIKRRHCINHVLIISETIFKNCLQQMPSNCENITNCDIIIYICLLPPCCLTYQHWPFKIHISQPLFIIHCLLVNHGTPVNFKITFD